MPNLHSGKVETYGADIPQVRRLGTDDLRAALAAGWADFKAAPAFGLFFALIYTLGGIALFFGLMGAGGAFWFIPVAAGFPLLAPFAAVGLYEVSRRREAGEPLHWGPVLAALRGHRDGQLPVMAVVVLLVFGFWVILARGIFAIFVGQSGISQANLYELLTLSGVTMLLIGTAVGGLIAFGMFTVTAFSLPLLLDRPVDFATAIIASIAAVRANGMLMLRWAAMIAGLLLVAMLPLFLGLLVVLPLLGHATWHLYRRTLVT
jgi:uncharacterized membrane protein